MRDPAASNDWRHTTKRQASSWNQLTCKHFFREKTIKHIQHSMILVRRKNYTLNPSKAAQCHTERVYTRKDMTVNNCVVVYLHRYSSSMPPTWDWLGDSPSQFWDSAWGCSSTNEWYGYGSIPINTIFRGMNIHLPAILMFTRGTRFWHTAI